METSGLAGQAVVLVVGFPVLLLLFLSALGWLESWMVQPDERAAAVRTLLESAEAEEIERAVARLMEPVTPISPPREAQGSSIASATRH